MANMITNFQKLWDNGAVSPEGLTGPRIDEFKIYTGAKKVIGARWTYRSLYVEVVSYVRPLPDRSGVVQYYDDDVRSGRLVVLNGDGTLRFILEAPRVDERSRPKDGYLALPPSSARFGGIDWGCEGSDGYTDYLFDFDWSTGHLLRYARPDLPW